MGEDKALSVQEVSDITAIVDSSASLDEALGKLYADYIDKRDFIKAADVRAIQEASRLGLHTIMPKYWPRKLSDRQAEIRIEEAKNAEQIGELLQAGKLYFNGFDLDSAIRVYEMDGSNEAMSQAALGYQLKGDYNRAGKIYVELDDWFNLQSMVMAAIESGRKELDKKYYDIVGDQLADTARYQIQEKDRHEARRYIDQAVRVYMYGEIKANWDKILSLYHDFVGLLVDWPDEKENAEITYYSMLASSGDVDGAAAYFLDKAVTAHCSNSSGRINLSEFMIELLGSFDIEVTQERAPSLAAQHSRERFYAQQAYDILVKAGRYKDALAVHQQWLLKDDNQSTLNLRLSGKAGAAAEVSKERGDPIEFLISLFEYK